MKKHRPEGLPSLADFESAAQLIYRSMPPTPQYRWPLLDTRVGTTVWVKHENHTPTGAFKVRGGLVYVDDVPIRSEAPRRHLGNERESRAIGRVCGTAVWYSRCSRRSRR